MVRLRVPNRSGHAEATAVIRRPIVDMFVQDDVPERAEFLPVPKVPDVEGALHSSLCANHRDESAVVEDAVNVPGLPVGDPLVWSPADCEASYKAAVAYLDVVGTLNKKLTDDL